jgi:hypothetical protein
VEGIDCPFPAVKLRVRDRYGTLVPLDFRIDTQADFAAIPIKIAQQEAIPFSEEHKGTVYGLAGETEAYRDRIRVVIAGREHDWPCEFVNIPVQRQPGQQPRELTPVLGRAGFLDEYALTIDDGYLILTHLGPVRRWWRQWLHALWRGLGRVHAVDQPL